MAVPSLAATPIPVPPPNLAEVNALRCAGNYLTRAGTSAASTLLGAGGTAEPDLLVDLCDSLLAAAALCAGLLDLVETPEA